jgi:hypothetical protein
MNLLDSPGDPCRAPCLPERGLMVGPAEPRSSCSPAETTQLRAEARRDLDALLFPSGAAGLLIVAIGIWHGPAALWPVWGTIGTTLLVALALGTWATYIRGWRILRTHRRRAAADSHTHGRVGVQPDDI